MRGLGRPGDVLFGITTTGRSANVVRALRAAREMGIVTVGLLGGPGEPARGLCDHALVVPATETARIQECHMGLGHAVLELLEDRLVARPDDPADRRGRLHRHHVAEALLARGERVLGVDNLIAYYDVRLKQARLARLRQAGLHIPAADVADREAMLAWPDGTADMTAIVHLAAQPGCVIR